MNSLSASPIGQILSLLSLIGVSNGWLLGMRLGLSKGITVLESALDEVEEVTDELGFLSLIDTLEELGVHLGLEELIKIDLKV